MEVIVPQPKVLPNGDLDMWPTLGPQVCDFIEERMVYGPGPLKGEPYKVRDDVRYIIYRAYEHYPEGYTEFGEDRSGRRAFNQVNLSLPKGSSKTEISAILAVVELHPDAPIRFAGYDPDADGGLAPGRSVMSPFIPLLAPTKDQLTDLAYGAAYSIISDIEDSGLFDPTMQRILINGEAESKILPVAANAGRLDGLKPTFMLLDESHRFYEDRQRAAYDTMVNNLPKRAVDDSWLLTTTTAGDPNEPSVARDHYNDAILAYEGKKEFSRTFFYHRQASDENAVFDTMEQRLVALREASGPEVAAYRDLFSVAAEWDKSGNDVTYLERVWCNRWVQSSKVAFSKSNFEDLGDPTLVIPPGSAVTLGFDGAQTQDSTALIMTEIETGIQNPIGIWERPPETERWRVPVSEVDAMVQYCYNNYHVELFYADPPYWQEYVSKWSGEHEGTVVEWFTKNTNNMYYAIRNFDEAIESGELAHNANKDYETHIGNAGRNNLGVFDDEGKEKYRLGKLSRDRKYDAAMAGILSWQARLDAIKKGAEYQEEIQMPRRLR